MRRTLYNYLALFCAAFFLNVGDVAARNTPLEAFIQREKQQHEFVTVRNFFQVDDAFPMTEIEKQVTGAQVLTLNTAALKQLMKEENRAMTLAIPNNNGGVYEVELARYDFFSHDFKMHLNHYNTLTEFNYTPGLYYSGVVKGVPGSVAAFTFFDNIVYGIFSLPGVGNIVVMENRTDASVSNSYLMYNDLN